MPEPHYRWTQKTDTALADVARKRHRSQRSSPPGSPRPRAPDRCARRSERELEAYSVTAWVRRVDKFRRRRDWHVELTERPTVLPIRASWSRSRHEIHPRYARAGRRSTRCRRQENPEGRVLARRFWRASPEMLSTGSIVAVGGAATRSTESRRCKIIGAGPWEFIRCTASHLPDTLHADSCRLLAASAPVRGAPQVATIAYGVRISGHAHEIVRRTLPSTATSWPRRWPGCARRPRVPTPWACGDPHGELSPDPRHQSLSRTAASGCVHMRNAASPAACPSESFSF